MVASGSRVGAGSRTCRRTMPSRAASRFHERGSCNGIVPTFISTCSGQCTHRSFVVAETRSYTPGT